MNPDEVLSKIKAITSPRMHRSLDAIFDVCEEQNRIGVYDFSYATIARLGDKKGVPKAQSIRNKTGEHYRTLIHAFSVSSTAKKPIKTLKAGDAWIDEIEDPKLRLLVQIQASRLSVAERTIKEIIPPEMEIRIHDKQISVAEVELTKYERQALEYLKSELFLQKWNFKKGPRGEVVDAKGDKVFKIATLDAINKVLLFL